SGLRHLHIRLHWSAQRGHGRASQYLQLSALGPRLVLRRSRERIAGGAFGGLRRVADDIVLSNPRRGEADAIASRRGDRSAGGAQPEGRGAVHAIETDAVASAVADSGDGWGRGSGADTTVDDRRRADGR